MYGSSIKCDVCMNSEFVDYKDNLLLADSIAPTGWIRIHVNHPKAWNWDDASKQLSTVERAADCCSIDCARSVLNDAYDAIPIKDYDRA